MNETEALQLFDNYEALIFDFGGIWIDIHYDQTVKAFKELGSTIDFNSLYTQKNQSPLFDRFETGKISEFEFISKLKSLTNLDEIETYKIKNAWNLMLGNLNERRMRFLKNELKTKRIFLLSNINPIHEKEIEQYLKNKPYFSEFYSNFEKIYFSHHVALRKPDPEIFKYVIDDRGLIPSKTLFIDDSFQHVESAMNMGLNTHWLNPSNSFLPE